MLCHNTYLFLFFSAGGGKSLFGFLDGMAKKVSEHSAIRSFLDISYQINEEYLNPRVSVSQQKFFIILPCLPCLGQLCMKIE